ncbi:hypothetical protein [Geodermatophilus sp. SYSU D00700]
MPVQRISPGGNTGHDDVTGGRLGPAWAAPAPAPERRTADSRTTAMRRMLMA